CFNGTPGNVAYRGAISPSGVVTILSTALKVAGPMAITKDGKVLYFDQGQIFASGGPIAGSNPPAACAGSTWIDGIAGPSVNFGPLPGINNVGSRAVGPGGSILSAQRDPCSGSARILRFDLPLPRYSAATTIPSADGREFYTFDGKGTHLGTWNS